MNRQATADLSDAKQALTGLLREHRKKALFVTELAASLRRVNIGEDLLEQALNALAADATLMVRDNFCADPHLAKVDLRVAAIVDPSLGADGPKAALREIDSAWNRWLTEYLANHRCG